jgi:hypothetical protein
MAVANANQTVWLVITADVRIMRRDEFERERNEAMTYRGRIQNGEVVLDEAVDLPEGTKVTITVLCKEATTDQPNSPSMYERWKPLIGIAKHLPPDASTKIDEVLYGRSDE